MHTRVVRSTDTPAGSAASALLDAMPRTCACMASSHAACSCLYGAIVCVCCVGFERERARCELDALCEPQTPAGPCLGGRPWWVHELRQLTCMNCPEQASPTHPLHLRRRRWRRSSAAARVTFFSRACVWPGAVVRRRVLMNLITSYCYALLRNLGHLVREGPPPRARRAGAKPTSVKSSEMKL